jgi:hypothetical protein
MLSVQGCYEQGAEQPSPTERLRGRYSLLPSARRERPRAKGRSVASPFGPRRHAAGRPAKLVWCDHNRRKRLVRMQQAFSLFCYIVVLRRHTGRKPRAHVFTGVSENSEALAVPLFHRSLRIVPSLPSHDFGFRNTRRQECPRPRCI